MCMTLKKLRLAFGPALVLAVPVVFGTMIYTSTGVRADSSQTDSRIQVGYNIAPVKLNTKGLNHALVGIGSYIVNAQADCNGCHTGGGSFFATFPGGANIFSRNLTPDISGKPEGGHTLQEFMNIMKTGHDYDKAHPPCPRTGAQGCILGPPATPLNGEVLQIMPWPTFSHMSDNDLEAIYEYLSAIPCIPHQGPVPLPDGTPPLPSNLFQACPAPDSARK
jgi:hypothetical protein